MSVKVYKRMSEEEKLNYFKKRVEQNTEMRLYGIHGTVFETKEELKRYCVENGLSLDDIYCLDYIRKIEGYTDIIRVTNKDNKSIFYTAISGEIYGSFCPDKSSNVGDIFWEFNDGNLREMYEVFKKRGIILTKDVYAEAALEDSQVTDRFKRNSK